MIQKRLSTISIVLLPACTVPSAISAFKSEPVTGNEGWYKDPATDKVITIGRMKTQTGQQCNRVVFKVK